MKRPRKRERKEKKDRQQIHTYILEERQRGIKEPVRDTKKKYIMNLRQTNRYIKQQKRKTGKARDVSYQH